jgi:hypothetical protein
MGGSVQAHRGTTEEEMNGIVSFVALFPYFLERRYVKSSKSDERYRLLDVAKQVMVRNWASSQFSRTTISLAK